MAGNRIGNSSGNAVGQAQDQINSITDPQDQAKAQFLQNERDFKALTTVNRRGSRDSFSSAPAATPVASTDDTDLTPGPTTGGGIGCRMGESGGSGPHGV